GYIAKAVPGNCEARQVHKCSAEPPVLRAATCEREAGTRGRPDPNRGRGPSARELAGGDGTGDATDARHRFQAARIHNTSAESGQPLKAGRSGRTNVAPCCRTSETDGRNSGAARQRHLSISAS